MSKRDWSDVITMTDNGSAIAQGEFSIATDEELKDLASWIMARQMSRMSRVSVLNAGPPVVYTFNPGDRIDVEFSL